MGILSPESHQKEVQQLFIDQKIKQGLQSNGNEANYHINREIQRLELGHCFSLGLCAIKRSGEGFRITFDLSKSYINTNI